MKVGKGRLRRDLGLLDIYCISTGAMFSSGFFLLPGLASAEAGPSVVLAYLIGGILVLPAMLSAAELSTAMPRAGGPYYFLDRSLGPLVGTIGGLGTWFALVFKSAFALIGIGAYLRIFFDVPIKPVALALTLLFMVMNILGAKKTSGLQVLLVIPLVAILTYFVVEGLIAVGEAGVGEVLRNEFTPFMPFGVEGLIGTVGFVFVSYAGLTQVATVSEEVKNPARDIPLGMILSLLTATAIYVLGVFVMVALLDSTELRGDLTPVATAAEVFLDRLPGQTGLILVVIAAMVAFASTGNAGILSAARYPFAMARDRLIWEGFSRLGSARTPIPAILATSAAIAFFIVVLDVEGVAKLASAFMLLIFGLLNLAVIVMRESRIASYLPDFRSPLYPWMQIAGMLVTLVLIIELGPTSMFFTGGMALGCILWYFFYAHEKVVREGAVYHLFARLGTLRYEGLDRELRGILKERIGDPNPLATVVSESTIIDIADEVTADEVIERASTELARAVPYTAEELATRFREGNLIGATPVADGVALPHLSLPNVAVPQVVVARVREGLPVPHPIHPPREGEPPHRAYALFFVVSDDARRGEHLRLLAEIATRIDEEHFLEKWRAAGDEHDLKETLLRREHYLSLEIRSDSPTARLVGKTLREIEFPEGSLVAMVSRGGSFNVPRGSTVLRDGDRITIIGEPDEITRLYQQYV